MVKKRMESLGVQFVLWALKIKRRYRAAQKRLAIERARNRMRGR